MQLGHDDFDRSAVEGLTWIDMGSLGRKREWQYNEQKVKDGIIKEVVAMKLRGGKPVQPSSAEYARANHGTETVLVYDYKARKLSVREVTKQERKRIIPFSDRLAWTAFLIFECYHIYRYISLR